MARSTDKADVSTGVLIAFAGLPGTGKTTVARALSRHLRAVYLRIDTVEQALRSCRADLTIEGEGYMAAYGVAEDNLRLGLVVVADSVNPCAMTRDAWTAAATRAGVKTVGVEVVCSDVAEHRRRVESRVSDIDGLKLPTWQAVLDRPYEPWRPAITLDTAGRTAEESVGELAGRLESYREL